MIQNTLRVFVFDSIQVSDSYKSYESRLVSGKTLNAPTGFVFIKQLIEGVQYLPNPPSFNLSLNYARTTAFVGSGFCLFV